MRTDRRKQAEKTSGKKLAETGGFRQASNMRLKQAQASGNSRKQVDSKETVECNIDTPKNTIVCIRVYL